MQVCVYVSVLFTCKKKKKINIYIYICVHSDMSSQKVLCDDRLVHWMSINPWIDIDLGHILT